MKAISGKEFAKIVERERWVLLQIQGSHHIYGRAGTDIRLSIPIHRNENLKIGLLKHLMKMAGISEDDLA
jgi:predicted RNA binding protein YcfA (HicA-like mRNA interferase family)